MSPEDQAQLRQLMRKSRQLPQPMSALLGRISRRFGTGAFQPPTTTTPFAEASATPVKHTALLIEQRQKNKK